VCRPVTGPRRVDRGRHRPDVVVMNIRLPPTRTDEGLRAVGELRRRRGPTADLLHGLTVRERDILALVAEGRSNRAIASRLAIAERTVEKHCTSIFDKLRLPADRNHHRRILAALRYLHA
jgi:DNA-binding NarL/FixJ family response regulator